MKSWIVIICLTGPVLLEIQGLGKEDDIEKLLHREKRSTSCKDKYQTIAGHSACAEKSPTASNSGVSDTDKTNITSTHNQHRGAVTPVASNMLKMTWDDEIAMIAQRWADACQMKHDSSEQRSIPGYLNVGQNIASGTTSWRQAIDLWHGEVTNFTYNGTTNELEKVGHYTQVVWADTKKIGCGYAMCGSTSFYVCNYGPVGNLGGINTPYKTGSPCSECSGKCEENLCVCAPTCQNGGELKRSDCTCKCKNSVYSGDTCELNCETNKNDPDFCVGDFVKNDCSIISQDCPHKCDVCPYGGINYVEGSVPVKQRNNGPRYHGNWVLLLVGLVYLHTVFNI